VIFAGKNTKISRLQIPIAEGYESKKIRRAVTYFNSTHSEGKILMAEINQQTAHPPGRIRSKKLSTRIDMTPMVDLAFLLLTFFILTTTLMKPSAVEVVMPDKPETNPLPPVPAKRVLTFILDENDQLFWRHGITDPIQAVDFSHEPVNRLLIRMNTEIDKMLVLIKASEGSKYKNLVAILDELEIAGINRYCIVDITTEDKGLLKDRKHGQ
jgi:biopolymer transport protein ExbD